MRSVLLLGCVSALFAADIGPSIMPIDRVRPQPASSVVMTVANMAQDGTVRALFGQVGLDVMSVAWEDMGRSKNSAWGPNITDLTIQPVGHDAWAPPMPVIRFPNFDDKTLDLDIDDVKLPVGNHRGGPLTIISLREYLAGFKNYQHGPTGYMKGDLLAARDERVLGSAQACLLPVLAGGQARFAPVLFSYQSSPGAPAVLSILVTPEGTSAQVIDANPVVSSGAQHGQRLFHNANGQRAGLTATRWSESVVAQQERKQGADTASAKATADGLSCVLVIQVPLVVPEVRTMFTDGVMAGASAPACVSMESCVPQKAKGMEQAVVGTGPVEGPWLGLNGCTITRDQRFPIRVTVQFYQATDTGLVTSQDVARISATIHKVYMGGTAIGSLVTDGQTGRPTEHQGAPTWPHPWYMVPCQGYTARTGRPWTDGMARIRARIGSDWQPANERELANALTLVE